MLASVAETRALPKRFAPMTPSGPPILFRSRRLAPGRSGARLSITPARAAWRWIHFAVRRIAPGGVWGARRPAEETCLVLLSGGATVRWHGAEHRLGPRPGVFAGYPHAVYLPAGAGFEVSAGAATELADCRARSRPRGDRGARVIRPEDCGFEIRGGGNATRQIVDIIRPDFPADRLMICEVYTPGGNWSSYPPHKHDVDAPPREADLDEIYYYRFADPAGYGFQRLYRPVEAGPATSAKRRRGSGPTRVFDTTVRVEDGDVVLVREGYHPFVTAHGYDAYYLNVLAGSRRSMAATDDPQYAALRRKWPAPDSRVPIVEPPANLKSLNPESRIPSPVSRSPNPV